MALPLIMIKLQVVMCKIYNCYNNTDDTKSKCNDTNTICKVMPHNNNGSIMLRILFDSQYAWYIACMRFTGPHGGHPASPIPAMNPLDYSASRTPSP